MLRILDTIKTIKRKKTDSRGLPIVQFVIIFNANMYERLDWRKVLIGERILCNAVKDIYFTSKMQFKKLNN
jgi:hypothetical protein